MTYLTKSNFPANDNRNDPFKQINKESNKDFFQTKNESQNSEANQSAEGEEHKYNS